MGCLTYTKKLQGPYSRISATNYRCFLEYIFRNLTHVQAPGTWSLSLVRSLTSSMSYYLLTASQSPWWKILFNALYWPPCASEYPYPMLFCFPCCRFSFVKPTVQQFFILWWAVFTSQVSGNIYTVLNLCICKCSKLILSVLFWRASFLSIMLIQNMDFLGFSYWCLGNFWSFNLVQQTFFLPKFSTSLPATFFVFSCSWGKGIWNTFLSFL